MDDTSAQFKTPGSESGRLWSPTETNRFEMPGASILIGGPVGQELPEHTHDFLQISTAYRSPGEVDRPGIKEQVPEFMTKPGMLRVIPAGLWHCGGWANGMEVVVVHLQDSLLEGLADEFLIGGKLNLRLRYVPSDRLLLELLREKGHGMRSTHYLNRAYLESLVYVFASRLVRQYGPASSVSCLNKPRLTRQQMRRVDEYLDSHMDENSGVETLARLVRFGPSRFLAAVRNTTGKPLHQYVIFRRVRRAKELLLHGNMDLIEIAFDLGFASQSHFGAVFKRFTSLTPRQFRNRMAGRFPHS